MGNKNHPRQHHFIYNKIYRLGLAFLFALTLLIIPVTAQTNIRIPVASLNLKGAETLLLPQKYREIARGDQNKGFFPLTLPFGASLVQAQSGLTITKSAPSMADQGGVLTYTLTITNQTGGPINSGNIVDPLPAELGCNSSGNPVSALLTNWAFGCNDSGAVWSFSSAASSQPIADGQTVELSYKANVTAPLTNGHAIVNSDYFISVNSSSTFGPPVTTTVKAPQWVITKTVSSNIIEPNQILVYTISVTNVGSLETSGSYFISDDIPANTSLVDTSPGATGSTTLVWSFSDTLAALGGTRVVTYSVQVNSPLPPGVEIINNGYNVTGGNALLSAMNDPVTVTVDSPVNLSVSKTASTNPIQIGEILTYTLTVTNSSSTGPAIGVVITDILPAQVTYQSAAFLKGTGTFAEIGGTVVWTLSNSINPQDTARVRVMVQVNEALLPDPPVMTNTLEASADNASPVSGSLAVGLRPDPPASAMLTVGSASVQPCATTPVTVTLFDQVGNPVPDEAVLLSVFPIVGNGTLTPNPPGNTNANGQVNSTFQGTTSGDVSIFGRWSGNSSVSDLEIVNVTNDPPLPDSLTLTISPDAVPVGGNSAAVTATVLDCIGAGNPVSGETVNFTLSNPGLATLLSGSDTTDASGQATDTVTSQATPGTVTITATSGALQDSAILTIIDNEPFLNISKTAIPAGGTDVSPGTTISYTIQVTNIGDANATSIVMTDTLPTQVTFVNVDSSTTGAGIITGPSFPTGNIMVLSLSQLEAGGGTFTAIIEATVNAGTVGQTLNNIATARSDTTSEISSSTIMHNVVNNDVQNFLPVIIKE